MGGRSRELPSFTDIMLPSHDCFLPLDTAVHKWTDGKSHSADSTSASSNRSVCLSDLLSPASSHDIPICPIAGPSVECSFPLHRRWCSWVMQLAGTEAQWEKISSFDTVEMFWRFFNNIRGTSNLSGITMAIFQEDKVLGAKSWPRGGCWVVTVNKAHGKEFDGLWRLICLNLIGEAFPFGLQCGATVTCLGETGEFAIWMHDIMHADVVSVYSAGVWVRKLTLEAGYKGEVSVTFHPFSRPMRKCIELDMIPVALKGSR